MRRHKRADEMRKTGVSTVGHGRGGLCYRGQISYKNKFNRRVNRMPMNVRNCKVVLTSRYIEF